MINLLWFNFQHDSIWIYIEIDWNWFNESTYDIQLAPVYFINIILFKITFSMNFDTVQLTCD